MTNNRYPNIKTLIINVFAKSTHLKTLKECRQKFIINVLTCFSSIKGKINFLQMSRFSNKCEQYFRINFENKFNFQDFNLSMIRERVTECIVAFDPSYIKKAVKRPTVWACIGLAVPVKQNGGWTFAVLRQWTLVLCTKYAV